MVPLLRLALFTLLTLAITLQTASSASAQDLNKGFLDNPANGGHYSGIGVVSGWHCLGGLLTVSFNGGEQNVMSYGGSRGDVRDARTCGGKEKVGFGTVINWALLGAGTHTAVVYRDGVEFARSTFTVGSTGRERLTGVSWRRSVRDFPRAGETTELVWNEWTQHLEIAGWQAAPQASVYRPLQTGQAFLENPRPGVPYSGIGIISGWKCSAVELTARVNGDIPFPVLYGNSRQDTIPVCGDADNGFVVPSWNWANLGAGTHTIVLYDQEVEFARSTFTVGLPGPPGDVEAIYVTGVNRRFTAFGFPEPLRNTDFEWNEASQHFEMLGGPGSGGGDTDHADQRTGATAVGLTSSTGGNLETAADVDYFRIDVTTAGTLIVETTGSTDTSGQVEDSSGTVLASNDDAGINYNFQLVQAVTPGTYYVRVSAASKPAPPAGVSNTGAYTLVLSFAASGMPPLSFGTQTIADQSYTQNTAITTLTLPAATGGTAPVTYSLSPSLPAGLSFNAATREVSGTPTATQTAATYTYTATDATGVTATLSFSLTVAESSTPTTLTNSIGMELVLIPAGTFQMGSPTMELNRTSEETLHTVTLTQPFYLSKHEVTQAQWRTVMRTNPSNFSNCDTCPVEQVSWHDAQAFIHALNAWEGVTTYRLPTEAEWEYAARGGTQTAYHFGNAVSQLGNYAWYQANSNDRTQPVGTKQPNQFGLYDMHGNVFEWVQDWYGDYPSGAVTDPQGPSTGLYNWRASRGGAWNLGAGACRAAYRAAGDPGRGSAVQGFRLARTP